VASGPLAGVWLVLTSRLAEDGLVSDVVRA
jgi:hypothetical protein